MYLDFNHFLSLAEKIIQDFKISTTKVTSGIDKGDYTSSLQFPDKQNNFDRERFLLSKYGCRLTTWTKISRPTKEESVKQLISDIALALLNCNRQKEAQPFSDIYDYYNKNKAEQTKNIHFKGTIGYNAVTFFEILEGKYTAENYTNKNNDFTFDLKDKLITAKNFKEFYYLTKQLVKEEWLKNNKKYTDRQENWKPDFIKVETFIFDEENIPEIENFENKLEGKAVIPPTIIPKEVNVQNKGNFKIGYRSEFLKSPLLYGREREIILANGEKHKAVFAIVELDQLLASHNETNFSSTQNYPTTLEGRNINDRNYAGDVNAQSKVISVSQNFEPAIVVSTSATASGTPIITVDGVVVSGNNRTMSLKLAKSQNKEQWENYLTTLQIELGYEGYGFKNSSLGNYLRLKERIPLPGSSFNNPLSVTFQYPVLVRIDYDFQSYTTDEMAKYNKSTKKSERPIDSAIKMSQQLSENKNCLDSLLVLISEQEIVSDLYNNATAVKRFKTILIECNLITENDVASLFTGNTLTDNGKSFYKSLLLSLILEPSVLEISQNNGVKSVVNNLVNAIIDLNKNKSFTKGNLIKEVNNAVILQNKMAAVGSTSLHEFIKEGELFGTDSSLTKKAVILNYWLNQNANDFKKRLKPYNNSIIELDLPNMFESEEQITEETIFYSFFEKPISIELKNSLNLVFETPTIQTQEIVESTELSEKEEIEQQLITLKTAYKYTPDQETADLIATLEITLKYL